LSGRRDLVLAATAPAEEHTLQVERFPRKVVPLVSAG